MSEPATTPATSPPQQHPERVARIDLAAIAHNVGRMHAAAAGAEFMAVVKANAYGHGAVPVARTAVGAGATWLGTAHVSEALALRQAGLEVPIVSWLHTPSTAFADAIRAGVDLGVSGWELEPIIQAARGVGHPARIHLKLDTGLGRNGSPVAEWGALLDRAARAEREGDVQVIGIFSHLAVADEPERPETDEQIHVFRGGLDAVRRAGLTPAVRHLANTPGVLAHPDSHFDLVRVGLGMYGYSPFAGVPASEFGLRPAMTLGARVANAKRVPAGQGISYGLTHRTSAATVLGLIPLGYGDGLPRVAEGVPVRIGERTYRSVGRMAMDQFVVDLGPDADPDDFIGAEAVLFGPGGPSVEEWAENVGTINYEMITRISERVPRQWEETELGETEPGA